MNKNNKLLVGIAGGSGSGKTTFLKALLNQFQAGEVALVSQDNYYLPKSHQLVDENGVVNFDLPTSIDRPHFYRDMVDLIEGKPIEIMEYNFNNPNWIPEKIFIQPAPIVIMEGLFVFHYEEICQQLDIKVYLDAQHDRRLERRIARDGKERGYPEHEVRYQWENHVRPSEQKYLEPYRSECDLIVDNNHHFEDGLTQLMDRIHSFHSSQ